MSPIKNCPRVQVLMTTRNEQKSSDSKDNQGNKSGCIDDSRYKEEASLR